MTAYMRKKTDRVFMRGVCTALVVAAMLGCLLEHGIRINLLSPREEQGNSVSTVDSLTAEHEPPTTEHDPLATEHEPPTAEQDKPVLSPVSHTTRDIATSPVHRTLSIDMASVAPLIGVKEPSVNKPSFTAYDVDLSPDLQAYLWGQCQKYGLDFSLLLALMEIESGYRSHVVSPTEDYGLMQINKVNHPRLTEKMGATDFLNPRQNMAAGAFMLGEIFETEADEHRALMVYNCGRAGAKRLWKKGIEKTTYSEKVVRVRDKIEERK